ncbi:MAG: hypothetical protein ACRCVJ_18545 [Clostridium sp.]|uniref:hypothetical protein n=1 Tax=Clostridium sp. TaxID=1506 RepID=UPI003F372726
MYVIEQQRDVVINFKLAGKSVLLITDRKQVVNGIENVEFYNSESDLIDKLIDDNYALEFYEAKTQYDVVIFSFDYNRSDLSWDIYSIIEDKLIDTVVVNIEYNDSKDIMITRL